MRLGGGTVVSAVAMLLILVLAGAAIALQLTGLPAETSATAVVPASAPAPPAPPATPIATAAPAEPPFVVKRILDIDGPLDHGEWHWSEEGAPAGPIVITIDLVAQTLSVFRDGYEIGTAVILYGADEKPTPLGVFAITEKDRDHVSNLYGAPMPYMLRLTNDGITIHGSDVEWGYVTHGCIGIPTKFAKLLFAAVKRGDRVIITNGERLRLGDPIPAA